jgi:hypothetical protein
VTRADTEFPTRLLFTRSSTRYEGKSVDGKQKLAIELRRGKTGVTGLLFRDASKRGKAGIVCARE